MSHISSHDYNVLEWSVSNGFKSRFRTFHRLRWQKSRSLSKDIRRKDFDDVIFNDVMIRPLKATLIVNSLLEVPVRCPRSINSRPDDMTHVTYPDMKFHEIHEFRRFLQRKYSTLEIYLWDMYRYAQAGEALNSRTNDFYWTKIAISGSAWSIPYMDWSQT